LSALPEPAERWLTNGTLAEPLRRRDQHGWGLVRDGCPSRMVGANRLLQHSQVDAWLTARKVAAEAKTDAEEVQAW